MAFRLKLFYTPNHVEDLALLTRHLAGSLASRAPLPDVIKAYGAEAEPGPMRRAMSGLAERVESGIPLSEALDAYPGLFPAPYRRLIRLGEEGRTLASTVGQLADSLEEGLKTYEFLRRAALYPLLVLVMLFLILTFIEVKIFPKYDAIFLSSGMYETQHYADGVATGSIYGLHQNYPRALSRFTLLVILIPIAIFLAAAYGLRIPILGHGRLALQLPLIGGVLRRAEAARFSGQLALLLENRIPMHEALGLLGEAAENAYVRAAIRDFQYRCEEGESLGSMLESQPLFPPGMAVLVAAAQDQGRLAETLRGLSRYYTERTAHGIAVMKEFVEPLLLIFISLIVVGTLAAIYLPLFDLPNTMR